jgi:uncharacterized protein YndB with AHSA1/START domain
MIVRPLRGWVSPAAYPLLAPPLLLVQHVAVALAFRAHAAPIELDSGFWLLPLRRLGSLSSLEGVEAAVVFAATLLSYGALAALSFRRAARSRMGFGLATFTVLPGFQAGAALLLAVLPFERGSPPEAEEPEPDEEERPGVNVAHVLQGLFAGIAILVLAVLLSALAFGAYGWGLFVMTPFLVGLTTAYLANRRTALEQGQSNMLVMSAAALGALSLVMLALEGLVCIIILAPLALAFAYMGGAIGRALALDRNARDRPLMVVALLPAIFALEAAVPPSAAMDTHESVDIAAPPTAVWRALTSGEAIAVPAGLLARSGLAYPLRGRLLGQGVGAERLGYFSTGVARERVTAWEPGRSLAFRVLTQPPAMEEMSPYRRVHAPHVMGYFTTDQTRFVLRPLAAGGTRLTVTASHRLKIDPIPYWEPLARWATSANSRRVLLDIKTKAERAR